jgi:hypothetical protein
VLRGCCCCICCTLLLLLLLLVAVAVASALDLGVVCCGGVVGVVAAVVAALDLAKQMTKALFAKEGKPIASDAELPESFQVCDRCSPCMCTPSPSKHINVLLCLMLHSHTLAVAHAQYGVGNGCPLPLSLCLSVARRKQMYTQEQMDSCSTYRTNAALRLREQVVRLQALLCEAPAVAVADVAVRSLGTASDQLAALTKEYSAELRSARARCLCAACSVPCSSPVVLTLIV